MTTMKSFLSDQLGGTAILFGLMLLPLMAAVGAAVDYSRAANVRTAMQVAADAAALLLARDGGTLSNDRLAAGRGRFFWRTSTGPTPASARSTSRRPANRSASACRAA
jgi:Flp pilus assembly protein TadG